MIINDQEAQYFNSEKYGKITYFIEKTDDVPQPYHLSFWGTLLDGYQLREVKLEIIQDLRKNLGINRKKVVWQKEHDRIAVLPYWRPYGLR